MMILCAAASLAACRMDPEPPVVHGRAVDLATIAARAVSVSKLGPVDGTRDVVASGDVGRVCQSMGCWFYLADEAEMVFIDLEGGSRFTIPLDSEGRRAVVVGTLRGVGGDRRLVADTVVLWSR